MKRRNWARVAMILIAPLLLFSLLLALSLFYMLVFGRFCEEWRIENRTNESLSVTPVGGDQARGVPILHQPTRRLDPDAAPFGETVIGPGERQNLFIDGYAASDIGGSGGLVIRRPNGEYRYLARPAAKDFILTDVAILPTPTSETIEGLNREPRAVNFGIPFGLIAAFGVSAPIILLVLRRLSRSP